MRLIQIFVIILAFTQLLPGCAARREAAKARLPTAETVCIVVQGIGNPGEPFLRRKAASYLAEKGFRLVEAGCDVTATYTTFNHGQWELIRQGLFRTKSSNAWRTEGIVALHRGTTPVVQDERVDIRDSPTMQDLLDDLASNIVEVVAEHYRPASPPIR